MLSICGLHHIADADCQNTYLKYIKMMYLDIMYNDLINFTLSKWKLPVLYESLLMRNIHTCVCIPFIIILKQRLYLGNLMSQIISKQWSQNIKIPVSVVHLEYPYILIYNYNMLLGHCHVQYYT